MDSAEPEEFRTGRAPGKNLEEHLGYSFSDRSLLEQALTHRSFANEVASPCQHNERLEFLGDAVVDLVATSMLMQRCVDADEGALSQARALVVSEAALVRAAESVDLGAELRLGRGEDQSGGRKKPSLLADAFEALVGAIYVDGGFAVASAIAERLLKPLVEDALRNASADPKTRLQEWTQARAGETPRYCVVGEEGPDHAKVFEAAAVVNGKELARGRGRSKKEAEQQAAERALAILQNEVTP